MATDALEAVETIETTELSISVPDYTSHYYASIHWIFGRMARVSPLRPGRTSVLSPEETRTFIIEAPESANHQLSLFEGQ